jgi:hypothetical protein
LGLQISRISSYRLEDVARSICSSSALVVEDPNQPAMMSARSQLVDDF